MLMLIIIIIIYYYYYVHDSRGSHIPFFISKCEIIGDAASDIVTQSFLRFNAVVEFMFNKLHTLRWQRLGYIIAYFRCFETASPLNNIKNTGQCTV